MTQATRTDYIQSVHHSCRSFFRNSNASVTQLDADEFTFDLSIQGFRNDLLGPFPTIHDIYDLKMRFQLASLEPFMIVSLHSADLTNNITHLAASLAELDNQQKIRVLTDQPVKRIAIQDPTPDHVAKIIQTLKITFDS